MHPVFQIFRDLPEKKMSCLIQSADGELVYFGYLGATNKKGEYGSLLISSREPKLPQIHNRGSKKLQTPTKETGKLQNRKIHAQVKRSCNLRKKVSEDSYWLVTVFPCMKPVLKLSKILQSSWRKRETTPHQSNKINL